MIKIDPIRERYYRPLELAEAWSDRLFYAGAVLAIVVVLVPKEQYSQLNEFAQVVFLVVAIVGALLGITIRLYWSPRALEKRQEDFLSKGLGVSLTHELTAGYYNNEEKDPIRRIALQLLENTYFSKEIAREMCLRVRAFAAVFAILWLAAITTRSTPVDVIVAISQTLVAEQMLSKLFRIEWFRSKCESIHDSLYKLLQTRDSSAVFQALVLSYLTSYESAKANSAVTLSSKIFEKRNSALSAEWRELHSRL